MKNLPISILLFITFFSSTMLSAQKPHNFQNEQLTRLLNYTDLTQEDIADAVVSSYHTSSTSAVRHFYFRQTYQGIEINEADASIHILPNNELLSYSNTFLKNASQYIEGPTTPTVDAKSAVELAASALGYPISEPLTILNEETNAIDQSILFSKGGISADDIPVHLIFQMTEDNRLRLAWDMSINLIDGNNWWSLRIDATTGELLHRNSWTVSCNLGHDHNHDDACTKKEKELNHWTPPFSMVGNYNVYAMPVESPNFGGRTSVANPEDLDASPFGWHDTNGVAGAEYTITRGNNVHAYEDGDNEGYAPDGGTSLIFNYPINTTYSSSDQSEDAAITNLFYWSNLCHDLWYQYGFDEASGNFQENNYGNGGIGGDYCRSEAQDGSGTCNANMGTPPDGSRPTMQMYVCNSRDGDLDNGVIVHEYGHGISTRLTGGAGNAGCLGNQEQMGEGWSDWFGMMMTIESGDAATDSRGMGTWLFGEGPNGGGIRPYPYSTDLSVNPQTYDDIKTAAVPHGVGSVWCTTIWEVAWALIGEYGFDEDFYNGTGGNNMAMALVTEGLKLQGCNPGFIDGRDAILAADLALYGGANECLLWEAFAKRGLGFSADQGSSGSATDGTEAFDVPSLCLYPVLSFEESGIDIFEESDDEESAPAESCKPFTDYEIKITLSSDPSATVNAVVNLSGSASSSDYEFLSSNNLSFPIGETQTVNIRVYNDAIVESDEDIILELSITNGGSTDAQLGEDTYKILLKDDDYAPGIAYSYEWSNAGFEGTTNGYTSGNSSGGDAFANGTSADASSSFWSVPSPLDGSQQLMYANDDDCNCNMSNVTLTSPVFDLSNLTDSELRYDVFFEGRTYQGDTETAELFISTNGGSSFSSLGSIDGVSSIWREESIDLSAYDGMNNIVIRFSYNDGGGWLYGIAIDHVIVEGLLAFSPEIATNLNVSDKQDVPPNAEVYFYDEDDKLIAGIQNGATNLGCVDLTIDRSGIGTTPFWDNLAEHNLINKTFFISPQFNSTSTDYIVTLYYTSDEITAWENETGNTLIANSTIVKHPTAISDVTPENPYPNGPGTIEQSVNNVAPTTFTDGYFIEAGFSSGFSGFGVGNPGTVPLPVELLNFDGRHIEGKGNQLLWQTASEMHNDRFEIQRSTDGRTFETIGSVKGNGTSNLVNNYEFFDRTTSAGSYYYRLQQFDFDGAFEFSKTIVIEISGKKLNLEIYPNPTKSGINILLTGEQSEATGLVLYNATGKLVLQESILIQSDNAYYLNLNDMPKGAYYGELHGEDIEVVHFRFVKE
ncbi:MAG: M36 family metallopeptidase [Saprospiraceae bacterium]